MTVIQSLEISGYRSFDTLRAEGLTRVNLLVGRNNAGKTSFLEALELLFLRNHPTALLRSPWRRQEVPSTGADPSTTGRSDALLDARQLFHGRELRLGKSFSITGKDERGDEIWAKAVIQPVSSPPRTADMDFQTADMYLTLGALDSVNLTMRLTTEQRTSKRTYSLFGQALSVNTTMRGAPTELIRPFIFASTASIGARERGRLWDLIVGNEDEDFVTDALRILEPTVDRIIFTAGDSYGGMPAPFVRLKGMTERIPLGNLGHGASRLLEVALLLVQARGGAFLVDEIEVGLHHSAMESVWQLLIETSRRLDIQVFATTHSKDCIQALASLYRRSRELADVVSMHRLEAGATRTERFSMDDVEVADDARLELRGLP
jgi:hypothetical protein